MLYGVKEKSSLRYPLRSSLATTTSTEILSRSPGQDQSWRRYLDSPLQRRAFTNFRLVSLVSCNLGGKWPKMHEIALEEEEESP